MTSAPALSREEIIATAARLFREHGYRGTTMKDIAAHLGVSHPALYYHVESKAKLLEEIQGRVARSLFDQARKIAESGDDPYQKLSLLIKSNITYVAKNHWMISPLFAEEDNLSIEFQKKLRALRKEYNEIFRRTFKEGQEKGYFVAGSPSVLIYFILGAANWVTRWYRESGVNTPEQLGDIGLRLLATGFLTPAASGITERATDPSSKE